MITNERQYAITRAAATRFAQALDEVEGHDGLSPAQCDLKRAGIAAQLEDLRSELTRYEALRDGRVRELSLRTLLDVPEALICARVAAGLTQKQLAARLGVREQQVQHDEANRYAGAGLDRLRAIAVILGVAIAGTARLPERGALPTVPSLEELLGEPVEPAALALKDVG